MCICASVRIDSLLWRALVRFVGTVAIFKMQPDRSSQSIRLTQTESQRPDGGLIRVNAFAHVQLRERACARAPVVCPLVDTFEAAREE